MKVIKNRILHILPTRFVEFLVLGKHFLKFSYSHRAILKEVRRTGKVRIAFIASSLSMWKSQDLVKLLLQDSRFDIKIVLSPFTNYNIDEQQSDIALLRAYFQEHKTPFVDFTFDGKPYDLRREFNPHIIFFVQTYGHIHCLEHDSLSFPDRLQAYIPYSFWPGDESWGFDLPFHREAWRIYYANETLMSVAKSFSLIKARNGRIVGYPSADLFINESHTDVWKIKEQSIKRIIWAPHFTISPEVCLGEGHSSFFALHEGMLEFAKANNDKVQIAFKPHPRLKTELYKIWGKKKTDAYYEQWNSLPNTQLETGSYIDLFMTSDALIHECGSFMIEYHYSKKPCMYVMEGFERFYLGINKLGRKALDLHYKGANMVDVEKFISDVVIGGNDTLHDDRISFYQSQLIPPHGESAARNIYNDLTSSLFR